MCSYPRTYNVHAHNIRTCANTHSHAHIHANRLSYINHKVTYTQANKLMPLHMYIHVRTSAHTIMYVHTCTCTCM